ncbi:MAG: pyridoxal phosphate-dependent aminotransferase [Acidobacteriota bacterium]
MRLSQRVSSTGESATLKVANLARELRARGESVIDLSVGQPDFDSPQVAVEAAQRALADGRTRYTANGGILELRRALAEDYRRRHGAPWSGDDVQVTVGAKMALYELAQALVNPGDKVVLPSPYWVSLPEQIRLAGGEPVVVASDPEDGFQLRAAPLLEAIDERTRAVLVNSPCNPTGGVMPKAELERLVAGCADAGIPLIADETYERFFFDGDPVSSAALAERYPETVVLVGSFSKSYAMTGWRLGYVFAPPPLLKALGSLQSHATSNPTSFAMWGAVEALERGEEELQQRLQAFRERRDALVPLLGTVPGWSCAPPHGAFYAFPKIEGCYRPGLESSAAVAEHLIRSEAVAVVPGSAFGREGHVRLSFACSLEELKEGVTRIIRALEPAG